MPLNKNLLGRLIAVSIKKRKAHKETLEEYFRRGGIITRLPPSPQPKKPYTAYPRRSSQHLEGLFDLAEKPVSPLDALELSWSTTEGPAGQRSMKMRAILKKAHKIVREKHSK